MKNLQNFEEFLNESSSFDTKRTKHIKFILGSVMPYKDKSFYFNFRKGTDEKEIEEILKTAEKGNRDIAKITRKYGKNPTSGDTVLELSDLNYSGLTWIFKELDDLYGQKGSGMGWFGDLGESINESYNDKDAYKAAVDILKTLHGFSDKIRFSTEDVNRYYNIVYDDPKGLTSDCLKGLSNNKFWNTEYAPTTGKFPNGRVNINFQKSAQEILDIENFDKKNWSPKK